MQEVPWDNLKAGKEYYIERIYPTEIERPINEHGTPYGRKKEGIFVKIVYYHGVPFTKFRNLINPPRNTEGPDLPSVLGSHQEENMFSTNIHRFYRPVSYQIARNQVKRKFGNMTNTNFGDTVIENNPYLDTPGGKKSRKTKKSKKTKKGKRSKKSRKNKKRH